MAIVLPLAVNDKLMCSAILISHKDNYPIFVSTLHQIGKGNSFKIYIPTHMGHVSRIQDYPVAKHNYLDAELIKTDPIYDLAFFQGVAKNPIANKLHIHEDFADIHVGIKVLVIGYPYAILNSVLETVQLSNISSKANRTVLTDFKINEFTIAHQTLPGSSGSAIVRESDGMLLGVLRGCLAPPQVFSIGDVPIGFDSNVTYITHSEIIVEHLKKLT